MITSKELRIKLGVTDQRTLKKYADALGIKSQKGGYNNCEQIYTKEAAEQIIELHDFLREPGHTIEHFLLTKEVEELRLKNFLLATERETIETVKGELVENDIPLNSVPIDAPYEEGYIHPELQRKVTEWYQLEEELHSSLILQQYSRSNRTLTTRQITELTGLNLDEIKDKDYFYWDIFIIVSIRTCGIDERWAIREIDYKIDEVVAEKLAQLRSSPQKVINTNHWRGVG